MSTETHKTFGTRLVVLETETASVKATAIDANSKAETANDKVAATNAQLAELKGAFDKALPSWAAIINPMIEAKTRELDNARTKSTVGWGISIAAIATSLIVAAVFGSFWQFRNETRIDIRDSEARMTQRMQDLETRLSQQIANQARPPSK